MFAGQLAGRALVVAAGLALGKFVQEQAAGLVEGFGGDYFAAEVAEVGEPVAEVEGKLSVELFAKALGECGAGSGGGDGDLEVSAADDGGEVEVAEGRVVDGVAEYAGGGGFGEDGAVDGGVVGCGYDEEGSGKVSGCVGALVEGELACSGLLANAFACMRGDDGNGGVRGAEGLDLRLGQVACADDDAWAGGELEEDREEGHG